MVEHEQLADAFVADAVLAGQDERVGEELLTDGANQLPLYVLYGDPHETATSPLRSHHEGQKQRLRVRKKCLLGGVRR